MADFTVTITAQGTLDGTEYNVAKETIVALTQVINRTVLAPNGVEVDVLEIGAAVGSGTLTDLHFFLFINRDDTNFVRLRFYKNAAEEYNVKVPPDDFFLMWNKEIDVDEGGAGFGAWVDIDHIAVEADTANCICEMLAGQA